MSSSAEPYGRAARLVRALLQETTRLHRAEPPLAPRSLAARNGFPTLLLAHILGHRLSGAVQGFDASSGQYRFEYKVPTPDVDRPRTTFGFNHPAGRSGRDIGELVRDYQNLDGILCARLSGADIDRIWVLDPDRFALMLADYFTRNPASSGYRVTDKQLTGGGLLKRFGGKQLDLSRAREDLCEWLER